MYPLILAVSVCVSHFARTSVAISTYLISCDKGKKKMFECYNWALFKKKNCMDDLVTRCLNSANLYHSMSVYTGLQKISKCLADMIVVESLIVMLWDQASHGGILWRCHFVNTFYCHRKYWHFWGNFTQSSVVKWFLLGNF